MIEYTINSLKVMGDKDEKFGYSYWGFVHEAQMPVMFSTHSVIDDVRDKGRRIFAEEKEIKQSKNGKEYLLLKKVKLDADSGSPDPVPGTETQVSPQTAAAPKLYNPDYSKDLTDHPLQVFRAIIPYVDAHSLIKDDVYRGEVLEMVRQVADELLTYSTTIRRGDDH